MIGRRKTAPMIKSEICGLPVATTRSCISVFVACGSGSPNGLLVLTSCCPVVSCSTIDVPEEAIHPLDHVPLHLRALAVDRAQNREADQRDQGQRGHQGQCRELCLDAQCVVT